MTELPDLQSRVRAYLGRLQDEICEGLLKADPEADFREDRWEHEPGEGLGEGGGITRIFGPGSIIERGGVNLSAVTGELTERLAGRLNVAQQPFHATGVSLVIHPASPMVPTVHMNLRYLELPEASGSDRRAWFGGGTDLTPYYLFEKDAVDFHRCLKAACDRHDPDYYPRFKKWCDEYFHLRHRGESRGIGGLFFDYLDRDLEQVFAFVQDVGQGFLEAYLPIVERRRAEPWEAAQREWQLIRRGRYVEFNLIYDRGTLFGLETGGRTESILMSLPPAVNWRYDHHPQADSREAALLAVLKQPVDWV